MDDEAMTAETFKEHVGTVFSIVAGDDRREIQLDRVEEKPELMKGAKKPDGSDFYTSPPFSLTFSGPRDELFGQALYDVEHAVLGRMMLFVKPFGEDDQKAYYESVFS
jgi:hypothetical protein